jgi:hypothetical protein
MDPSERHELGGFQASPWAASVALFGFVDPIDRLGQAVILAIVHVADGRHMTGSSQALDVFDREVLYPAISVMNKPTTHGTAVLHSLLRGVQRKPACAVRLTPPTDNPECFRVDHASRQIGLTPLAYYLYGRLSRCKV